MKAFCQRIHTENGKTTATFIPVDKPNKKPRLLPVASGQVKHYAKKDDPITSEAPEWYVGQYYEIPD